MSHQSARKRNTSRRQRRQAFTSYMMRLTTITAVTITCVVIQDMVLRRLRISSGDTQFAVVASLLIACLSALFIGCVAFWAVYVAFEAKRIRPD